MKFGDLCLVLFDGTWYFCKFLETDDDDYRWFHYCDADGVDTPEFAFHEYMHGVGEILEVSTLPAAFFQGEAI